MKFISTALVLCFMFSLSAQVTEIELRTDGIIFPRMNTSQRNALTPVQGQCIYNTQSKSLECYDGTNWSITSSQVPFEIKDNDGDTYISLEQTTDEDTIRFNVKGTEVMKHDGKTLHIVNSGESVFIGEDAGMSDDLSNNQNTFIGYRSGEDITTGTQNVAVGNQALRDNITGSTNIAIGKEALAKGNGSNNIAIGHNAGRDVTNLTTKNTMIGGFAGFNHTEGGNNTFIGYETGKAMVKGEENTFIGYQAGLKANTPSGLNFSASYNTFIGSRAGSGLENGFFNTLIGGFSGSALKEGGNNVAINGTLYTKSNLNVMIGAGEDWFTPDFIGNTMVGGRAGNRNDFSVQPNGRYNTFIGANSGNDQNGSFSIVLGAYKNAFRGFNTGGHNNVLIGNHAAASFEGTFYSNKLFIQSDTTFNTNGTPLIYGEFDNEIVEINGTLTVNNLPISAGVTDLRVDSNGRLVKASSDIRLKHSIVPIQDALKIVNQLQGVTYIWNDDPSIGIQYGLIAQDVQKVIPEVVNEHDGMLGLDYTETIGILIEAIKELSHQNELLKTEYKAIRKLIE